MRPNYVATFSQKASIEKNRLLAIVFCAFDDTLGPTLKYQHPENRVGKDIFDALKIYLIPKPQDLYEKLITITAFDLKIVGYPVIIKDSKYSRNQLIFNLSLVFTDHARTTQYEPVIQKLAHYFRDLELEKEFISKSDQSMVAHLKNIFDMLNVDERCILNVSDSTTIHLKVTKVQPVPDQAENYHVPVILKSECFSAGLLQRWDLTTQQIHRYIDGFNHIGKIAILANADVNLVKACIQNLIYYGIVTLVPIFQYSNVYVTTPKMAALFANKSLQQECLDYVRLPECRDSPTFRRVLHLYSHMRPGMTVKDLCLRFDPAAQGIDIQLLVRFGLLKEFIRRIQKYTCLVQADVALHNEPMFARLTEMLDGRHSYDQICSNFGATYQELDEFVDKNCASVSCWK